MDPTSNRPQSMLQLALGPWSSQVLAPGDRSPWALQRLVQALAQTHVNCQTLHNWP